MILHTCIIIKDDFKSKERKQWYSRKATLRVSPAPCSQLHRRKSPCQLQLSSIAKCSDHTSHLPSLDLIDPSTNLNLLRNQLTPFQKVHILLNSPLKIRNAIKSLLNAPNSAAASSPRFFFTTATPSSFLNVNIPQPVCLMRRISSVPRSCSEMTREHRASRALAPAFRMTCASPRVIPYADAGSIRASMQVTESC